MDMNDVLCKKGLFITSLFIQKEDEPYLK